MSVTKDMNRISAHGLHVRDPQQHATEGVDRIDYAEHEPGYKSF